MTTAHAAALHFSGRKEAAKKRLQKLRGAGLINERGRRVNESSILFLSRKGFSLLSEHNLLADFPALSAAAFEKRADVSALTLRHELDVMDVKAAVYSALRESVSLKIVEFSTWPRLHEFKATRSVPDGPEILVKPDGFIRIHEQEKDGGLFEHTFFLELDRSTETQSTLVSRLGCYLNYYKSGGFALANGSSQSAYKDFPFRVLVLLKNTERRNNTAERLLENNPPILTMAYLSTSKEFIANPLGEIWIRPTDYREAITNGRIERPVSPGIYRRSHSREAFIEPIIKKAAFLAQ
jgi:hypothetical protein